MPSAIQINSQPYPNCKRATSELLQHLAVPAWSTTRHSLKKLIGSHLTISQYQLVFWVPAKNVQVLRHPSCWPVVAGKSWSDPWWKGDETSQVEIQGLKACVSYLQRITVMFCSFFDYKSSVLSNLSKSVCTYVCLACLICRIVNHVHLFCLILSYLSFLSSCWSYSYLIYYDYQSHPSYIVSLSGRMFSYLFVSCLVLSYRMWCYLILSDLVLPDLYKYVSHLILPTIWAILATCVLFVLVSESSYVIFVRLLNLLTSACFVVLVSLLSLRVVATLVILVILCTLI